MCAARADTQRRQPQQPFVPCLQIRADERAGTTTGGMLFDGEAKQGAGRTGRHDDDPAAPRQAVPRRGETNQRPTDQRQAARPDHVMPPGLLASQFATLEEPVDALAVESDAPPETIVNAIVAALFPEA